MIVTVPVPDSIRRNLTSLLPNRVSPPAVEIAPVTVRSPSMAYRPGRWTSPSTVTYWRAEAVMTSPLWSGSSSPT